MLFYPDAAWAPGCSDSTLGACQPTAHVQQCRNLCAHTLGCVGFTFVKPEGARVWDQKCLGRAGRRIAYARTFGPNTTATGRCCLEATLPSRPRLSGVTYCVAGELEPSALCHTGCRMPWPTPSLLDSEPPAVIDAQVRRHHGATASVRTAPWVELGQRVEMRLRRQALRTAAERRDSGGSAPVDDDEPAARVAVCVAGAARTFVHPAVGWAFERFVRGAAGPRAHVDVFVALGTGVRVAETRIRPAEHAWLRTLVCTR